MSTLPSSAMTLVAERFERGAIGDVGRLPHRAAALGFDFLGDRVDQLCPAPADDHVCARFREAQCDGAANP